MFTKKTVQALVAVSVMFSAAGMIGCSADDDAKPPVVKIDTDGDGVPDGDDNCRLVSNPNQTDTNKDGVGNACDGDGDGVPEPEDNCPLVANADQKDTDGDGIGDACETDTDGDGKGDDSDNCPFIANPDQKDTDRDGIGDACEPDRDNDGVIDDNDNCPAKANADQKDTDGDGIGDVCDSDVVTPPVDPKDTDRDGVPDTSDNCPLVPNADQKDSNDNGIGDACETAGPVDSDKDGVPDSRDNCPLIANADQKDTDGDGIGDACDNDSVPPVDPTDTDGDGVPDNKDNCPAVANADQKDTDGDGKGDACDEPVTSCTVKGESGYQPLSSQNAIVTTSNSLLCLACSVVNPSNILDNDIDSAAVISIPVGLLGSSASLKAATPSKTYAAGTKVGFTLSQKDTLLTLSLLDNVTVRTYKGNALQEVLSNGSLLDVDLLGLVNSDARVLYSFTTTKDFNALEISAGGLANVLYSVDVHAACIKE